MRCLVSIVVPVYNVEQYLEKCIESILNQSLRDIELILIDDGSTDKSGEICDYYKNKDNRIIVEHINNVGVSNARNIGIDLSRGKYIMFSDSDDYVDEYWCEIMYNAIEKNNKEFIICGYTLINKRNKIVKEEVVNLNSHINLSKINKKNFYLLYKYNLLNSPCNKIYERKVLIDNDIKYDSSLSLGEDMLFNLKYLDYIYNNIIVYNKPLYNYVLKEGESLDFKFYPDLFEIYKILYSKLYSKMQSLNVNMDIYLKDYWISYFYMIEKSLNNTFSTKNRQNLIQKLYVNKKILISHEFNESLQYLKYTNENKVYLWALQTKKYIIIIIVKKLLTILYIIKKMINNINK